MLIIKRNCVSIWVLNRVCFVHVWILLLFLAAATACDECNNQKDESRACYNDLHHILLDEFCHWVRGTWSVAAWSGAWCSIVCGHSLVCRWSAVCRSWVNWSWINWGWINWCRIGRRRRWLIWSILIQVGWHDVRRIEALRLWSVYSTSWLIISFTNLFSE